MDVILIRLGKLLTLIQEGSWESKEQTSQIIDGDSKTFYMSDKTMTVSHGFIVDFGKETEFYWFKFLFDGQSYGHGKNLSVEYNLDKETWTQFPKINNKTFVFDNPP